MSSGSLADTGMTLQDVQMKEAQAELLLLQCWGDDSTSRADPESSSKRHSLQDEGEQEDKSNNKWARPESKGGFGRGGRGKGNQASSQDRSSQQRQAPRRQMKDRQGKDIEGMMWMLGRLLLRHEDQMGIDKTENNVMFFKKDSALSLVPTFVKKAEHWHSLKEQKQAKMDELALPLRTFLFHSMLEALLLRLKETTQSQDQLGTAMTLQVFLPKEDNQDLLIPFLKFDPETKALTPLSDRQATTVTEMINKVQELQKLCLCQLAVLRFHSTQKLQGPLQGPTVPFLLQIASRTPEATRSMTQSAVWQLVGGSLRPERMGRSALAAELAKRLQGSRPQFHASSESAIVPITVMQTLLCVHFAGSSSFSSRHR